LEIARRALPHDPRLFEFTGYTFCGGVASRRKVCETWSVR